MVVWAIGFEKIDGEENATGRGDVGVPGWLGLSGETTAAGINGANGEGEYDDCTDAVEANWAGLWCWKQLIIFF